MTDIEKVLKCLALELPEAVYDDAIPRIREELAKKDKEITRIAGMAENLWDIIHEQEDAACLILQELLSVLPDTGTRGEDCWTWCWDELNDEGQTMVKTAREHATDFLAQVGKGMSQEGSK